MSLDITEKKRIICGYNKINRPLNYLDTFSNYYAAIKSDTLKNELIDILSKLPNYFWHIPASLNGHNFPKIFLLENGLVYHTIQVVKLVIRWQYFFNYIDDGQIIIAAILHDGMKYGLEGEIQLPQDDHGIFMADWLRKNNYFLSNQEIITAVELHLARWSFRSLSDKFCHINNMNTLLQIADFQASRQWE